MNTLLRNIAAIIFVLSLTRVNGQIKMMSYNLLNFPTGNLAGRVDTLRNIVNYSRPNLLMIQELKNAEGLQDITDMMNEIGYGDFAHGEFIAQQSPGSPGNLLQHAIIYDAEIFRIKSEGVVLTNYRDINEYVLYLNDPSLANGTDTTFLYVYVTHLKSSTGADNVQARLEMVNYLVAHLQQIPENSNVIFAGDFNLYDNMEPAYTAITNPMNAIVLKDVFESYGNWAGSGFNHKEILTQSTRIAMIYDDGAGGGIDDRFDFILLSESLMNPDNELHYIENSFHSVGNNGTCYNESITDCEIANEVPSSVLQSLYYMSDHLPQYCELNSDLVNIISRQEKEKIQIRFPFGNIADKEIALQIKNHSAANFILKITDMYGREVTKILGVANGTTIILETQSLACGFYLLTVLQSNGACFTEKFAVKR